MPTAEFGILRPNGVTLAFPSEAAGLPVKLTSFVGREQEIDAVVRLLQSARLLTLTGVGGAGKTRLALEVAARVGDRFCGTAWVDLSRLTDATLVPNVVVAALGLREEAGHTAQQTLVARLREDPPLLILDNCEHLVEACAALVGALLRHCPEVRILSTSREALGVSGEQAWLVPPLTLPETSGFDASAVAASEAGRLFTDRARSVLPSFTLTERNASAVAQICRRLDGIPLAIELAAARVRVLAPEQIAARLEESFRVLAAAGRTSGARHRTLEEAIDWSHALLSEAEAALFRRLTVFVGSFGLDAVEAICPEPPVSNDAVLDLLSALVDKSMVVLDTAAEQARYRLLEALRRYGRDKLRAAGEEDEFCARHATFFVDLVSVAERPTFGGGVHTEWTRRLVADEANLRAAAEWAESATQGADVALRLAAGLHWHWFARGQFREGQRLLHAALARSDEASPRSRAKALAAAGTMAFWLGEHDAITAPAQAAVTLLRELDDPWYLSYALTTLGIGISLTDPGAAPPALAEAVAVARPQGKSVLLAFALYWQARVALTQGDLELARANLEDCYAVGRAIGHGPATAHPLSMLGILEVERGALDAGAKHLFESLELHAENNDRLGVVWALEGLAKLAQRTRQPDRATRLLAAALAERERLGTAWSDRERRDFETLRSVLREETGSERFDATWSASYETPVVESVHAVLTHDRAAMIPAAPVVSPTVVSAVTAPAAGRTLEVRALGHLEVRIDGTPLDRSAWSSARPRELLLFLLCHPDGRTREQVGVAFWPDASSEQVRNNFHVTMHRLRKALGDASWITLRGDKYAVNPAAHVEFDALSFEREVQAALVLLASMNDPTALETALARYGGDFLEQESAGDWHLEWRDRLRYRFLNAQRTLGAWFVKHERWREAAAAFRRLIAREELDEPAYRELMRCHQRLGERAEAIRVFRRLEQLLRRELEAEPEPETKALYQRIRAIGAA